MTAQRTRAFGIVAAILILLILAFFYTTGEFFGNSFRVRLNLSLHKQEYSEMAEKFLAQNRVKNIAFNADAEIINNCGNHLDSQINLEWSCTETDKRFKDKKAVLDYLGIPEKEYLYYTDFLRKNKFNGLGKSDEKDYVELEDKLKGLRYYKNQDSLDFVVNKEYLSVKKIDDHWFSYSKDWN